LNKRHEPRPAASRLIGTGPLPMLALDEALKAILALGLMPLWAAAGLGDWLCHRAERIEQTAGVGESALHALMLGALGSATLAYLTLEVTASVLVYLVAACVVHELLFWADLAYASHRRPIGPVEQWFHCVQFAVPWAALVAICLLHADQFTALLGFSAAVPDWTVRPKTAPFPTSYVVAALALGTVGVVLPFLEELWRCLRATGHLRAAAATAPSSCTTLQGDSGKRIFLG
jgi:hypothetical protein